MVRRLRANCAVVLALCLAATTFPARAWLDVLDDAPALAERLGPARPSVYASARLFAGNDWTAMVGILDDSWSRRYSPRNGRNLGVAFASAEAGVAWGGWRAGYVQRAEAVVDASRDTIDLLHMEREDLPIPVGRRFALQVKAEVMRAEGLRIEKTVELYRGETSALRASLGAAWLEGKYVRTSEGSGYLQATGPDTFSFEGTWSDAYTGKTYRFLTPGSPKGSGHAIDAAVEFEWAQHNRLLLAVADLHSRIAWRDVPSTRARATSDTATRDAQGFVVYQPTVAGRNSRIDYVQQLDPKTTVRYTRSFGRLSAAADALVVRGNVIPRVSLDYRPDDAWRFAAEYDVRFGSVGVLIRYRQLSLAVTTESLDLDRAKALGFAARVAVPF